MCCRSVWVRSARPCRRSASSSPTRPTPSSICASWRASAKKSSSSLIAISNGWCLASTRSGRRSLRGKRTWPGPRTRKNTSFTFPKPARSGAMARATVATRCSARSASRSGSLRRWPATRAGWPSTCSSSASRIRRAKKPTWRRRSRARVARRTLRCSSRRRIFRSRAGKFLPSATTSPGSNPMKRAACVRSTPRRAFSASRPARAWSPTPTRWPRSRRTRSSPMSRSHPKAASGGKA